MTRWALAISIAFASAYVGDRAQLNRPNAWFLGTVTALLIALIFL
jgi:hypothetical protein